MSSLSSFQTSFDLSFSIRLDSSRRAIEWTGASISTQDERRCRRTNKVPGALRGDKGRLRSSPSSGQLRGRVKVEAIFGMNRI
jgi:hypothetical protein